MRHLGGKNTMTFSHKLTQCDTVVQSMADPGFPRRGRANSKRGCANLVFWQFFVKTDGKNDMSPLNIDWRGGKNCYLDFSFELILNMGLGNYVSSSWT